MCAKISKERDLTKNERYLGYDEDHEGDFNDYFMCPKCRENNYIPYLYFKCDLCNEPIEWAD